MIQSSASITPNISSILETSLTNGSARNNLLSNNIPNRHQQITSEDQDRGIVNPLYFQNRSHVNAAIPGFPQLPFPPLFIQPQAVPGSLSFGANSVSSNSTVVEAPTGSNQRAFADSSHSSCVPSRHVPRPAEETNSRSPLPTQYPPLPSTASQHTSSATGAQTSIDQHDRLTAPGSTQHLQSTYTTSIRTPPGTVASPSSGGGGAPHHNPHAQSVGQPQPPPPHLLPLYQGSLPGMLPIAFLPPGLQQQLAIPAHRSPQSQAQFGSPPRPAGAPQSVSMAVPSLNPHRRSPGPPAGPLRGMPAPGPIHVDTDPVTPPLPDMGAPGYPLPHHAAGHQHHASGGSINSMQANQHTMQKYGQQPLHSRAFDHNGSDEHLPHPKRMRFEQQQQQQQPPHEREPAALNRVRVLSCFAFLPFLFTRFSLSRASTCRPACLGLWLTSNDLF